MVERAGESKENVFAAELLLLLVKAELFDAVENVPDAGDEREEAGPIEGPLIGRALDLQQHPAKRDHLEKCRALAHDARSGGHVPRQHMNQHRPAE